MVPPSRGNKAGWFYFPDSAPPATGQYSIFFFFFPANIPTDPEPWHFVIPLNRGNYVSCF